MSLIVIGDVVFHQKSVCAVDGHGSVESPMDGTASDVGSARLIASYVEVERVPTHLE